MSKLHNDHKLICAQQCNLVLGKLRRKGSFLLRCGSQVWSRARWCKGAVSTLVCIQHWGNDTFYLAVAGLLFLSLNNENHVNSHALDRRKVTAKTQRSDEVEVRLYSGFNLKQQFTHYNHDKIILCGLRVLHYPRKENTNVLHKNVYRK